MKSYDIKWRFERLYEHTKKDGYEFFSWLGYNLWEIIKIPYDLIRDFKDYLGRIRIYSKLLFSDRDYDWTQILAMLQHKIKLTADHIEEHQIHTNWAKDVKVMREVIRLIDIVSDDHFYHDEVMKEVEAKYGRHIWYTECDVLNKPNNLCYTTTFKYQKENDSNRKEVRKAVQKAYKKEAKLMKRDWDKLWRLLNENLRNWWC